MDLSILARALRAIRKDKCIAAADRLEAFRVFHDYTEPFDAPKQFIQAVSAAPESVWGGASGKLANAAGGLFQGTEGRMRARWTSLQPTYGRKDHRVVCALPANAQIRSNDSV